MSVGKDERFNVKTVFEAITLDGVSGVKITVDELNCSASYTKQRELALVTQAYDLLKEQFANVPD